MAHSTNQSKPTNDPLPPDERFWKRYSPHHEALLSGAGSLTVHGLVVGIMILAGWAALWARSSEARRPPAMDVVQLAGDGEGAGGGEPAPLGGSGNELEGTTKPITEMEQSAPKTDDMFPVVPSVPATEVPESSLEKVADPTPDDVSNILKQIGKDATRNEKPKVARNIVKKAGPTGVATGQAGGKGRGGFGGGTGTGRGRGAGAGRGGPVGPLTKQQIFAQRWRFDMSGSGREHAAKLAAAGVMLIIYDQFGNSGVVRDLKRSPVVPVPQNLAAFKNAVQWTNNKQDSLYGLAMALKLRFVPIAVTILLPKDREEKMAEAEAAYAQKQGRPLDRINETWFDFRLVNGRFEPVVIRQN